MRMLRIEAPAKLNLTLDITGLTPNGYHSLDMVMLTVSLCDTIELAQADNLSIACPPGLPRDERNLALRAAMELCRHTGRERGALITLEKRIPMEAGLGGGSADAAAVLKGLNELWELGLPPEELREIGAGLGSDVPFALAGGAARVRGMGDVIEPTVWDGMKSPKLPLWFLIAKPEGGVSTAEAYRLYDRVGAGKRPDTDRFIEAFKTSDIEGMARFGGNALEKAAVELRPEVGELLKELKAAGAGCSAMTGSGSAVFGVFQTEGEAARAQKRLTGYWSALASPFC